MSDMETATALAWLNAQLDEDEQTALDWRSYEALQHEAVMETRRAAAVLYTDAERAENAFQERYGPSRALTEVEAKRRQLDRHQPHSMGECRVCEAPHWASSSAITATASGGHAQMSATWPRRTPTLLTSPRS